uniref:hypothetical protein n=1 Tax=Porodaedalea mongolica TaxID=2651638 RepID=UPI0021ACA8F4|nr:hypothetical protein NYK79_mgp02 [Porodaedalea mongolica]UUA03988.1 hypothetical protein [Porodaedalea mongolica]WCF76692.1 hypothetical protein [Porodaedalea mongolica]
MKLRQLLLPICVLLGTAIMAIFLYDLLNNLDADSLVTNNNVVLNNQISARDVKNLASNLTSNNTNSTISFSDGSGGFPAGLIVGAAIGGIAIIALGLIGISICYIFNIPSEISLSFIPLIGCFTKFKNVKWLKYFIVFVLLTLLYFLKNYEVTKLFSIFRIIMGFNLALNLFISYNAISILILLKNLQMVDLKIFKYLPKSIRKYLLDLIEISRSETRENNVFLKLYIKGILIATFYLIIFNILMFYIS